ncbi:MAG: 50S ribosomal protein L13 [Candidatus Colwellbacteria bacterium]|nr:50S ribosomal protein L13 [Candidatus Colwellbacteria bacterium]
MSKITIDAKNQTLGRLASQIASLLQGKDDPKYNPRLRGETEVVVKNVSGIKLTGRKMEQKVYYRHSGRPGHLKKTKYKDVFPKRPDWVLRNAVSHMLPKNRLQKERMKMLVIEK